MSLATIRDRVEFPRGHLLPLIYSTETKIFIVSLFITRIRSGASAQKRAKSRGMTRRYGAARQTGRGVMNINDSSDPRGVIFSLSHSRTDELIL